MKNLPKLPTDPEVKVADTAALNQQRQRRAATGGRQGTLLTGTGGLGSTGAGAPRATLLGG